jgi:hypothetical protein
MFKVVLEIGWGLKVDVRKSQEIKFGYAQLNEIIME